MRLLLVLVALPLAAGAAGAQAVLDAREDPYRFAAGEHTSPVIVARAPGEQVTVQLHNRGSTGHNWQVEGVAAIPFPVRPGESGTVTFSAPAAGSWRYACLAHEAHGMRGELRVAERGVPLPLLATAAALISAAMVRARVAVAKP